MPLGFNEAVISKYRSILVDSNWLGEGGWKWLRARRQEVLDGFITDVCKDVTFLIAIFRTVGRMMDTLWHWEDNRVIGNWRGTEQVEGAEVDLSNVRFTTASGSTRKAWAWQRMRRKISHILWIVMGTYEVSISRWRRDGAIEPSDSVKYGECKGYRVQCKKKNRSYSFDMLGIEAQNNFTLSSWTYLVKILMSLNLWKMYIYFMNIHKNEF
jgi:hypothetical protein